MTNQLLQVIAKFYIATVAVIVFASYWLCSEKLEQVIVHVMQFLA